MAIPLSPRGHLGFFLPPCRLSLAESKLEDLHVFARATQHVLMTMKLSHEGQETLRWTVDTCDAGDTVTVLYIVESLPGPNGPRPVDTVRVQELESYKKNMGLACMGLLQGLMATCEEKKVAVSMRVAHGLDEKEAVRREAENLGAAKVVIGDYG
eukprot:TRINITY_DN38390_c0_g1_i1.p1 TRINITY_DN38390_c0_g1~~TRINITY_DN38390_c0_g1_i1.p1  ORF type:complete len:180 (+),score=13.69 TRINITY_DN38390_c0_g1_i1:77-541(+)